MFKSFVSFLSMFLLAGALMFGSTPSQSGPPQRQDLMDKNSKSAEIKLSRAESTLATLVPDPQSYTLLLSSNSTVGAEAVPPGVFSDKPTMIVYQGCLSPDRSNEELAFVMAHELGHLNLHHGQKMEERMDKIMLGPPVGISGLTFSIFQQKLTEREADLYGFNLYKHAGYDMKFFPYTLNLININPNIHFGTPKPFRKQPPSMTMNDSHFSMKERFQLLTALATQR